MTMVAMTVVERARAGRRPAGAVSGEEIPGRGPTLTIRRLGELLGAGVAGVVCVLLGVLVVVLPTVLAWVVEQRSTASFWQTVGVGVDVWALAHRAAVRTPAAEVVLAPLLLTALFLALCWYAARQVVLSRHHLTTRVPRIGGWRTAWSALGGSDGTAFVLGYVVAGLLLAHTASFGLAPVRLATLVPGVVLVPLVALGLVWWGEHRREEHPVVDAGLAFLEARTPVLVRRALPPVVEVLVGLVAVSFLLVLGLLLLRGERILTLYGSLDAGLVGTVVLTVGQLLALPNLMVWALGWTTGSGVTVGTAHVGWGEATAGDLPLLPVLGALPEPGSMPPGIWAMALVPLVAGGWLGYRAAGSAPRLATWWTKTQIMLASCVAVALVVLVLSWLATGGLTPGLLGTVGVEPWRTSGLLLAELVAGGLLVLTVLHLSRRRL
ncbi:putative integral membrane protein [Serinicoccus hydrothermalis]|uniref:Putative integral membrane protein n=2 Tax=Serinicoccus hydrothermalis TaxID=1758689 RepID=A0A1B1NGC4_9MICO|nr:putative integral membrane protein [Serinicoccus hydrothermalis]